MTFQLDFRRAETPFPGLSKAERSRRARTHTHRETWWVCHNGAPNNETIRTRNAAEEVTEVAAKRSVAVTVRGLANCSTASHSPGENLACGKLRDAPLCSRNLAAYRRETGIKHALPPSPSFVRAINEINTPEWSWRLENVRWDYWKFRGQMAAPDKSHIRILWYLVRFIVARALECIESICRLGVLLQRFFFW